MDKEENFEEFEKLETELSKVILKFIEERRGENETKEMFITIQLALSRMLGIYLAAIINTIESEGPEKSGMDFKNREDINKFFINQTEMLLRHTFSLCEKNFGRFEINVGRNK